MQKDSDDEVNSGNMGNVELLVQRETHFEKFEIRFRKVESKEEVKQAISVLERDALLLNLIPIAINEDLESKVQIASLLVETPDSINILRLYFDFL